MANPTASNILLSSTGINKTLATRQILNDVDIAVKEGQIVTLIGPNGAGKTTLVRILLGLLKPDSGIVYMRPALRIGYMPQRLFMEPTLPMSVRRFLRLADPKSKQRAEEILSLLNVRHLAEEQMSSISGGELQRVLLARALLRKPQLLILDEPAQGVDISGQSSLYTLINQVRSKIKCGILMISHDLHLVMSSTDEVVCLNQHVCCHGRPDKVSAHPAFLELFGTNISSNLAVYTHQHNHEHDIAGEIKPTEP
ncbi:MAG: zinc ABC transporter ATP-binding protein ZnuC [Gammaproteobacteria bacterium]|nr:zinc ABC transporter ATP-binding protein ZnuC [Gammaproteobacteria bacterium]|tara:strand:+ start:981 stop:1742 length:762 start_codon:yes stop_codon:yes gene_type:complete